MLLGLGITSVVVFPKRVISQTITYEESYIELRGYETYPKESPPKQAKLDNNDYTSCVRYAQRVTGVSFSVGVARNWPHPDKEPTVGGIVVTSESHKGENTGHVAVITHVYADTFEVIEANYERGKLSTREIKKDYKLIIGYWHN